jgi:hypothetical protein
MGEAKRRRDYERAHADEIAADLTLRRERFALIEEIAASNPGWPREDQDRRDARLSELNALLELEPDLGRRGGDSHVPSPV